MRVAILASAAPASKDRQQVRRHSSACRSPAATPATARAAPAPSGPTHGIVDARKAAGEQRPRRLRLGRRRLATRSTAPSSAVGGDRGRRSAAQRLRAGAAPTRRPPARQLSHLLRWRHPARPGGDVESSRASSSRLASSFSPMARSLYATGLRPPARTPSSMSASVLHRSTARTSVTPQRAARASGSGRSVRDADTDDRDPGLLEPAVAEQLAADIASRTGGHLPSNGAALRAWAETAASWTSSSWPSLLRRARCSRALTLTTSGVARQRRPVSPGSMLKSSRLAARSGSLIRNVTDSLDADVLEVGRPRVGTAAAARDRQTRHLGQSPRPAGGSQNACGDTRSGAAGPVGCAPAWTVGAAPAALAQEGVAGDVRHASSTFRVGMTRTGTYGCCEFSSSGHEPGSSVRPATAPRPYR